MHQRCGVRRSKSDDLRERVGTGAYWIMQKPRSLSQLRPRTRCAQPSASSQMREESRPTLDARNQRIAAV